MQIGVLAETNPLEPRVAASQDSVKRLTSAGCSVVVEQGFADHLHWTAKISPALVHQPRARSSPSEADILFAVG